jgi:hypothetical protein
MCWFATEYRRLRRTRRMPQMYGPVHSTRGGPMLQALVLASAHPSNFLAACESDILCPSCNYVLASNPSPFGLLYYKHHPYLRDVHGGSVSSM